VVDGDSAYGTGANLARLNQPGLTPTVTTGFRPPLAGGSPNFSSASTSPPDSHLPGTGHVAILSDTHRQRSSFVRCPVLW
jgi:hypothetical protein